MLQVDKINQFYGQSHTLWDLEVDIPEKQCTCLMGRNGVGKTTLVKSVMGLLPIQSGQILFEGQDISRLSIEQRPKLGIGYVPQGREIFAQLTVRENLQTGLFGNRNGLKRIPEKIFHLFPVLKEMLNRKGGDLSGGQQQQLAIGRALCIEPKLLILDEPVEGIQPNIVQLIGEVLQKLIKEDDMTVLLVEQKLPFARKFANRFVIMDKGRQVAKGGIEELSDAIVEQYLSV